MLWTICMGWLEGAAFDGVFICRPYVEAHGVDHDDNVDGFSVERVYTVRKPSQYLGGAPSTLIVQLHKDKNQFSLQSESDSSYWHRSALGALCLVSAACNGRFSKSRSLSKASRTIAKF